jgi:hypothetical protein
MNKWNFNEHKYLPIDQWQREGKPERSDCITIDIDKKHALDLAAWLLCMLQNCETPDEKLSFWLMGELQKDDDRRENE